MPENNKTASVFCRLPDFILILKKSLFMQTVASINPGSTAESETLGFGRHISSHMLVGNYKDGQWQPASVLPYGNLSLAPANLALHYGQSVFEGMKAFRMANGDISIFRIQKHWERLCRSLQRMCMPAMPFDYFRNAITNLVCTDASWVPRLPDTALYIRPLVFATEETLGVKVSDTYCLAIFTGPVGAYYQQPLRVKIETEYIRAAEGGSGYAKCAGNYGAAFYPAQKAKREGFDQLLWTDGKHHEFIEEAGTMNVMFVIDDIVVTPPLTGTILDGITRDSLISLAMDKNIQVQQRRISYHELIEAADAGILQEAFGVGTAAVVSRIESIHINGQVYRPAYPRELSLCEELKHRLRQVQTGQVADLHGWNTVLSLSDC